MPPSPGMESPGTGYVARLDGGLAKTCPEGRDLTRQNYRSYRRRVKIFKMCCTKRGAACVGEGALLMLQLLEGHAWTACESIEIESFEDAEDPFEDILQALDKLYHYDDQVELPNRIEKFFQEFGRLKGENLQEYLLRHQQEVSRLKELGVELPDMIVGWHMLARSGVPPWQLPTVRSACKQRLSSDKVREALVMMFGADSKPNVKDIPIRGRRVEHEEANWLDDDVPHFYLDDEEPWEEYEDEAYVADSYEDPWWDEVPPAEVPEELDEAYDDAEEAYVNWVDSRRRMKELANSRGFYPVVALIDPPPFRERRRKRNGQTQGQRKRQR